MAEQAYTYSIASDFPSGAVNTQKLHDEVVADTAITTQLDRIDTDGDGLSIVFQAALSAAEKTALDGDTTGPAGGLIAQHDNSASAPDYGKMQIDGISPDANGSLPQAPIISTPGHRLNDRDVLVRVGEFDNPFEDLRVNPDDNKEVAWGEVTCDPADTDPANKTGVFKLDGNGDWVRCTDQTDAAANAGLTVLEYQARQGGVAGGDALKYDVRGGTLWVDSNVPDDGDRWSHRVYSVGAPDLSAVLGGRVPFFDGYLFPYRNNWMQTLNPVAFPMDPSASAAASIVRVWFYYKAGTAYEHVLRFHLYRPTGSW